MSWGRKGAGEQLKRYLERGSPYGVREKPGVSSTFSNRSTCKPSNKNVKTLYCIEIRASKIPLLREWQSRMEDI